MKGINTINHEITPKPCLHKIFKIIEKSIITINFNKAVLYRLLNISSIICVELNKIYNNAGGHIFFNSIYNNIILRTLADCLLTRFPNNFVDSRYDEQEKLIQVVVDKKAVPP